MKNEGAHTAKKKKRSRRKNRTLRTILIVLLVLILLAAAAVFYFAHDLFKSIGTNVTQIPTQTSAEPAATPAAEGATPEPTEEPTPEPTPVPTPTEEELQAQREQELLATLQEEAEEIAYSEDVYNLLLIGADGTSEVYERGDSMILLSVNRSTKEIWITSLMRDTQVSLYTEDGNFYSIGHLNWATSWGGVGMLVATIEDTHNFAVHIDNWAMVNFLDFVEIADMLGPITVSVTAEEAQSMDSLIRQVAQMYDRVHGTENGGHIRSYFPEGGGENIVVTDGIQMLGYCRERHVGGDKGRSARQREVLELMWNNVRQMNILQQYDLLKKVMSVIQTDLTEARCYSLMLQAPAFINYKIYTQQSPAIGAYNSTRDNDNLSIYNADWRVTRNLLRATIYGEEMTDYDLTSYWTGVPVLVADPSRDDG